MMTHPIEKFNQWYKEELVKSKASIPSACCLSTLGLDGFPNARFLSLKEVRHGNFIITGPLGSLKGKEIKAKPEVALTFWWEATLRQIRVQGIASEISSDLASVYFDERNQASKVVSLISEQGMEIKEIDQLKAIFFNKLKELENEKIARPKDWGGFSIAPTRIEFMEFKESRFHLRECYTIQEDSWDAQYIQP
ncbi:pyridoxal 5'-phosphate synthase [Sungkyunkwania multivorans]|uniref:Pyridoxal 5'-phosphate synthase n=1 Tax=Sungkyunkwania multivorans TaxID=1173618 RepID=A0ABW3CUB6_9FLAO